MPLQKRSSCRMTELCCVIAWSCWDGWGGGQTCYSNKSSASVPPWHSDKQKCFIKELTRKLMLLLCKHSSAPKPVCCCRNSSCPELLTELVKLGSLTSAGLSSAAHRTFLALKANRLLQWTVKFTSKCQRFFSFKWAIFSPGSFTRTPFGGVPWKEQGILAY